MRAITLSILISSEEIVALHSTLSFTISLLVLALPEETRAFFLSDGGIMTLLVQHIIAARDFSADELPNNCLNPVLCFSMLFRRILYIPRPWDC